jgi:hypothetical protein
MNVVWRLPVDNSEKAKDALKGRTGALGEVGQKLAQAKINIKYAYATSAEGSAKTTVILAVPDVEKALGVLGGWAPRLHKTSDDNEHTVMCQLRLCSYDFHV